MRENRENGLGLEEARFSFLKKNLADFLTISRAVIGLVILSLGPAGEGAYLAVVIMTFVGGATDILDGKAARRYLGENREGRLGGHDAEIDTFMLLCVLCFLTFAGIVTPGVLGFGWAGLVVIAYILSRRSLKVLVVSEIVTVISLLGVALFYNPQIFWLLVAPLLALGLLINRKRVIYLIFDYWPGLFSR